MGDLLYVYICSLNAKSKDTKPCQLGHGEGRRTLPKLSFTLCAKTIHTFLFLIILLSASVGLNLLTYHGEWKEQRSEEELWLDCCPSVQHQQLRQHIYQRAPSGIIFKTICFKWGLMHQTHTHIYTHTHIMKAKIMEKHFIPKRYSWVSLFYSFGHLSRTFASNALMLGGCTCLLRHRQANSFLGLIIFIVTLLIP